MSQSKSVFLFSISLRRDLRQTAAHRFIGLLSEAAQKPEEGGEAFGRSRRRLYKFLHEKSAGKEPCLLRKEDNGDNYDKRQTARKTKELSGKKNQK